MKLYLMRHAAAMGQEEDRLIGWTDPSLSGEGRAQAHRLQEKFGYLSFDGIYTSDLIRAAATASIVTGRTPYTDIRLREQNFGAWEARTISEIAGTEPGQYQQMQKETAFAPPYGESYEQMNKRVIDFLQAVDFGENTLIVAHQGSLRSILTKLIGMDYKNSTSFWFEMGKYTKLENVNSKWVLKKFNV